MEKKIALTAIIYFLTGLVFAVTYAWFYHWGPLSYFSPGFYFVVATWPFQIIGFITDFQTYGLTGKILT